jgi:hypothetical protein
MGTKKIMFNGGFGKNESIDVASGIVFKYQ